MTKRLVGGAVLLALAAGFPAWGRETGKATVDTRRGRLNVVPEPWDEQLHGIQLGENIVFGAGFDVRLYGNYELGAQDVVLAGDDGKLNLLILEPGKEPDRLMDDRFFSRNQDWEVVLKDGRLDIDLGLDDGRRKRAVYDGHRLYFIFEVAGYPAWTESGNTIATRAGEITVVPASTEPPRGKVKLGEDTLFEGDYVTLYGKYPLGAQDVVLVGDNCGGTACWTNALSLLVLEPGKKAQTFSDNRFLSLDGTLQVAVKGQVLEIELGFDSGKRKLVRFDGKHFSMILEDRGHPPLTEKECKQIYENTMATCGGESVLDPGCKDPKGWTSGASWRSIIPILQKPGFSQRAFTQACVDACKRGEAPPLDAAFKRKVCRIGEPRKTPR